MIEKVKQQSYVTFVGVPGSGKTATARHIALKLEEEGYEILPIKKVEFIETFCDPNNPQVFLLDDVVGIYGFDMKEFDNMSRYEDRFIKPTMQGKKIIMTCREDVFKNEYLSNTFISQKENVVMLHSAENALTDQDKYDLFSKYNINPSLLASLSRSQTSSCSNNLSNTSKMFPLICKFFSNEEKLRQYGPIVFVSPVPCLLELLENMGKRNKIHYASLVLLMINQNKLSETDFENKHTEKKINDMKCQVFKKCKLDPSTAYFELIDALTEMEGTYTEQCQSEFKFVHDSMFEIVAWHFGRRSPELILQYMDSDYIANNIKMEKYETRQRKQEKGNKFWQTVNDEEDGDRVADKETVNDLCITLKESHCHLLADRLFKDIKNGELFNVFEKDILKHPLVLENFINVMENKTYLEVNSVFLTEVVNSVKKLYQNEFFSRASFHLLIHSRNFERSYCTLSRAIRWVISYGHSQILQFIIDQIIKNTKQVIELFQTSRGNGHEVEDDTSNTMKDADWVWIHSLDTKLTSKKNNRSRDQCTSKDQLLVIVEQRRLLLLGCLSGDLPTVRTLLRYLDKSVLNLITFDYSDLIQNRFFNYDTLFPPLIVSSKVGHLSIVIEL